MRLNLDERLLGIGGIVARTESGSSCASLICLREGNAKSFREALIIAQSDSGSVMASDFTPVIVGDL